MRRLHDYPGKQLFARNYPGPLSLVTIRTFQRLQRENLKAQSAVDVGGERLQSR
jgi:hypothetical protein